MSSPTAPALEVSAPAPVWAAFAALALFLILWVALATPAGDSRVNPAVDLPAATSGAF